MYLLGYSINLFLEHSYLCLLIFHWNHLMHLYNYKQKYYSDAINELDRYFKTYPNHNRKDYAYYLLAICYYDQIVDEKKDLGEIKEIRKEVVYSLLG